MSIPDCVQYIKNEIKIFTRRSEFEPESKLDKHSIGIWLDSFESIWFTADDVAEFLNKEKFVCIVSPELHGRVKEVTRQWSLIRELSTEKKLMVCTDFPEKAADFFNI